MSRHTILSDVSLAGSYKGKREAKPALDVYTNYGSYGSYPEDPASSSTSSSSSISSTPTPTPRDYVSSLPFCRVSYSGPELVLDPAAY